MSRWLTNVGNFLDQLDDKAEEIVTEEVGDDDLQQLLASRSLSAGSAVNEEVLDESPSVVVQDDAGRSEPTSFDHVVAESTDEVVDMSPTSNVSNTDIPTNVPNGIPPEADNTEPELNANDEANDDLHEPKNIDSPTVTVPSESDTKFLTPAQVPEPSDFQTPAQGLPPSNEASTADRSESSLSAREVDLQNRVETYQNRILELQRQQQNEIAVANKEARTLRRHMANLNEQLEAADKELGAQQKELDDAALRLTKDRQKYKDDRDSERSRHASELKQRTKAHEQTLVTMKVECDEKIAQVMTEVQALQDQRQNESGSWNKELTGAANREQELVSKCELLEDEKATLLQQISTLQTNQSMALSRLESLTQTVDNAMTRERQAEERLDDALSLHARQVSQRQQRESQLEQQLAELSAALVAERGMKTNASFQAPGDGTTETTYNTDMDTLSVDVEMLRSQVDQERQQVKHLQKQLLEVSQERDEEASIAHKRQEQHDTRIDALTHEISQLKMSLEGNESNGHRNEHGTSEDTARIASLSEEVMRQRDRLSSCTSELSTLRTRLHVAMNRATVAEAAAESAYTTSGGSSLLDVERGTAMRSRRTNAQAKHKKTDGPSMRAALSLDGGVAQTGQRIGKSLDIIDGILSRSGNLLRYNPVVRLLFVAYLLVLHLWTLALLVFHTHNFETVHGDFGATLVGPTSLLKSSDP